MADDVDRLKVTELREELKKRGLSTGGNKATLAQRLKDALAPDSNENGDFQTEGNGPTTEGDEEKQVVETGDNPSSNSETVEDNPLSNSESDGEGETTDPQTNDLPGEQGILKDEDVIKDVEDTEGSEEPMEGDRDGGNMEGVEEEEEENQSEEEHTEISDLKNESGETTEQPQDHTCIDDGDQVREDNDDGDDEQNLTDTRERPEDEQGDSTSQDGKETEEEEEEEMETVGAGGDSSEEKPQGVEQSAEDSEIEESEVATAGSKRPRDEVEDSEEKKEERQRPDPTEIPDPQCVEDWSDKNALELCQDLFVVSEVSNAVTLDPCNSNLDFIIQPDGLGGSPLTEGGFAHLLSGTKATWGVKNGKYYYECKIEEQLSTHLPETEETPYLLRIGWSPLDGSMVVGEGRSSFGYESSGVKVNNRNREEFGEGYSIGDVISCFIDLSSDSKTVSFAKNGEDVKEAFTIVEERVFFPHVTSKNVRVSFNFGGQPATFPAPEGYSFLQEAVEDDRELAGTSTENKGDCEVIFTIGLPASGKTYWASRQLSKYPEKRYTLIGTSQLMDRMTASGLPEKIKDFSEWDSVKNTLLPMIETLCVIASHTNRNYIVDQVNVYKEMQEKRTKLFEGFQTKCMVCIPPHHELRKRKGEQVKNGTFVDVPLSLIDGMKGSFSYLNSCCSM